MVSGIHGALSLTFYSFFFPPSLASSPAHPLFPLCLNLAFVRTTYNFYMFCEMRQEMEKPSVKGIPPNVGSHGCRPQMFWVPSKRREAKMPEE